MTYALDFAGSELRDLATAAGVVTLRLAAASARDARGARGWLTGVTLAFEDATLAGDAALAFGTIAEGRLVVDGRTPDALAVPSTRSGDLHLALRLANGAGVTLRARRLVAALAADARFADDHSC